MIEKRRTQKERREGTIRTLLDAATDTLIEVGYAEASTQRICTRTELSQGALFRHFATREALMVAVGEDVGAQLLAQYRKKFTRRHDNDVRAAMKLLRDTCRSRLNQAWYELATAARTNETLRKALEPVARRYYADIAELARALLPDVAAKMGDAFELLVGTIIAIFDGESLHRFVLREPRAVDDARIELLAAAFTSLAVRG